MDNEKKKIDSNRLKAIFNMVFYLLMIFFLIMAIRSKPSNPKKPTIKYEEVSMAGFEQIAADNFEYSYSLVVDEENYVYSGKRLGVKDQFTLSHKGLITNYFTINDIALIKDGDNWQLIEFPVLYFNFLNTDLLSKIISSSLYSKENNRYEITTTKLLSIFDPAIAQDNLSVNTISLVYTNKTITVIEMDITNLAKHYQAEVNSAKLTLNYLKFGKVDKINIGK